MKYNLNLKTASIFTMIMAITLSVMACTNGEGKVAERTKTEETVPTTATANVEDISANDGVSFMDGNKKVISLKDLKGKVVFINFWATWCPPCIHEMPSIASLKKRYKDNPAVVFLMVDVDGNYEKSKKFMDDNKFDLPVHVPNGDIPSNFLGNSIPTTVILDQTGKMIARMEGGRDYMAPEMIEAMDDLVANK